MKIYFKVTALHPMRESNSARDIRDGMNLPFGSNLPRVAFFNEVEYVVMVEFNHVISQRHYEDIKAVVKNAAEKNGFSDVKVVLWKGTDTDELHRQFRQTIYLLDRKWNEVAPGLWTFPGSAKNYTCDEAIEFHNSTMTPSKCP